MEKSILEQLISFKLKGDMKGLLKMEKLMDRGL